MYRLPQIAVLGLLLGGCAGQQVAETAPPATAPAAAAPEVQLPERPIPADSVYPLLLAEFALRRRDYDLALEEYLRQAPILRDPAVSAHATHLAQYLQREPEALEAVQLWVELEPDNAEANNTLAILLVRRGRNIEAAPSLAQVARAGQQANFPILLNGFQQMDPDGRSRLVSTINELAVEFPDNSEMLLTRALMHEELGQPQRALATLDTLFEQDPYQYQAVLLEAKILLEKGSDEPFERLQEALEAEPDNQQMRLQYARMLTRSDMEAARKQFEILSAQSPEDADLLLSLALINRETGDDLTASAYLKQMLALDKRSDEAHYYLGRIAEDKGDVENAVGNYMKVQQGRDFFSANSRIGRILLSEGQGDRLHAYFTLLRERHPERSERLWAIQSDLHKQAGDAEGGIWILTLALEQHPESTSLRYARAMSAESHDDLRLMESDLRQILAREPDNATALNALGYTLANRTERYSEAEALISRALELQPDEPAILDSMGWVLYRLGRYDDATRYLRKAYARFPDPEVAAHLGEVLWVKGDATAARKVWRQALQKDPGHKVLHETLQRLGVPDLIET